MADNRGLRRLLLAAALAAFAIALIVFWTGGVQLRVAGTLLRARGAERPLIAGLVLLVACVLLDRRAAAATLRDRPRLIARLAPWVAGAAALSVTVIAFRYGAFVAGGADSYGYLSEAYGWARGELPRAYPIPLTLPFESSDWLQAPLGYRPGQTPHTLVPTYSPGLPLLMAIAIWIADPLGPYLLVPLSAGAFVWAAFVLARRLAGPAAGAAGALIAATSPVALFLVLWPMTDVPAGALWTGAAAAAVGERRRDTIAAGICAALGILVRVNLAPLAVLPAVLFVMRRKWKDAAIYCAIWMPAAMGVAVLYTAWYGSPLLSGYGSPQSLFSTRFVWPNLQRFIPWLWQSQSAGVLAALIPIALLTRGTIDRGAVLLAWAVFLATLLLYLPYLPFDAWWFLRFLLPGLGALFALMAAGLVLLARHVRRPWGSIAACAAFAWMIWHATTFALALEAWGPFKASEHKYAVLGTFIDRHMPPDAVFFSVQHSGSIRYYGGRHTLRYDRLDLITARRAPGELERLGLHPYMAIEDGEAPFVRKAFGLKTDDPLPWPAVARLKEFGGATIYDLATRSSVVAPVPIDPAIAPPYSPPVAMRIEPAIRSK